MASVMSFRVSSLSPVKTRPRCRLQAPRSLDGESFAVMSPDSVTVNGASPLVDEVGNGNGRLRLNRDEEIQEKIRNSGLEELAPLWDDGYGTQTVEDYFIAAKELNISDGGPPRWFCPVELSPPLKDSPILLFLPGD